MTSYHSVGHHRRYRLGSLTFANEFGNRNGNGARLIMFIQPTQRFAAREHFHHRFGFNCKIVIIRVWNTI